MTSAHSNTGPATGTAPAIVPPGDNPVSVTQDKLQIQVLTALEPLAACQGSYQGSNHDSHDERQRLVRSCTGQTIHVQNLLSLMPAWFKNIHPKEVLNEVNAVIDEWLKTVNHPDEKKRKQRQKGDYVIISSVFYADCSREKLITLTKYNYWIFMFDDEIDPGGDLTRDQAGARRVCDQTLRCIHDCLHPDPQCASFTPPAGSPGTVEMLYEILGLMRPDLGTATMGRLRRQLCAYVEGVLDEQSLRQGERLPDPYQLLQMRCTDIGVVPSVTQIEYAMDFELPDHVVSHEAVQRVVLDCAALSALVNEILSLEKEFRVGQLENLCTLFVNAEGISIHDAIEKVKELIRERYQSCEAAVERLLWTDNEQTNEHLRLYVQCCQRIASGTAQWPYMCTRYFDKTQLDERWHMTATLCT